MASRHELELTASGETGIIELDKRRTEWVSVVLNGMRHTPFSRIKTMSADLTFEDARAGGDDAGGRGSVS